MAANALASMARILTNTSGTGTYQLGATPAGYANPFIRLNSGDRATWRASNVDGTMWEEFEGVLTAGSPATLTRAVILETSGLTTPGQVPAAVNWPDNAAKSISLIASATWMRGVLQAAGEQRQPSGRITKWGTGSTSGGGGVVTFSTAFPTACTGIKITPVAAGVPFSSVAVAPGFTAAGFSVYSQSASGAASSTNFLWEADGY